MSELLIPGGAAWAAAGDAAWAAGDAAWAAEAAAWAARDAELDWQARRLLWYLGVGEEPALGEGSEDVSDDL